MAVPKKKKSYSKKRIRQVTFKNNTKKLNHYQNCDNCGKIKRAHHICQSCGHYDTMRNNYSIFKEVA